MEKEYVISDEDIPWIANELIQSGYIKDDDTDNPRYVESMVMGILKRLAEREK